MTSKLSRLLLVSFFIKLLISALLPLSSDEAYYWVWGQNLQWSYFDHPPFVAWLYAIGDVFHGWGGAVRWPGVLLGHVTFSLWAIYSRKFLTERETLLFAWLYLLSPMLGFGSLIVTPDIPLLFFWSVSFFLLEKALEKQKKNQPYLKETLFLGATLGLGFCSKYNIVIFFLISLVFLTWKRRWGIKLLIHLIFLSLIFILFSSPVWIWNIQNDWISFRFQTQHGLGATGWKPQWTVIYVLGQMALIFPTIVYFSLKNSFGLKTHSLLKLFAWGPLLFFLLTSFKGHVEANWPLVAYPAVLLFSLLYFKNLQIEKTFRPWAYFTLFFWILIQAFFIQQVFIGRERSVIKKVRDEYKFQPVYEFLQEKDHVDLKNVFVRNYQMAGKLSFLFHKTIPKLKGMNRVDFFDRYQRSVLQEDTFYVVAEPNDYFPEWIQKEGYVRSKKEKINEEFVLMEYTKK